MQCMSLILIGQAASLCVLNPLRRLRETSGTPEAVHISGQCQVARNIPIETFWFLVRILPVVRSAHYQNLRKSDPLSHGGKKNTGSTGFEDKLKYLVKRTR